MLKPLSSDVFHAYASSAVGTLSKRYSPTDVDRVKKFFNREKILSQLNAMVSFLIPDRSNVKLILNVGGGSFTDGKSITVGLPHIFIKSSYEEIFTVLQALTGHEAQHINSSDFEAYKVYQEDVADLFVAKYKHMNERLLRRYMGKISVAFGNGVEDGRIEKILGAKFPGYIKYLKFMNGSMWSSQEIKGNSELEDFLYCIVSYSVTGLDPKGFNNVWKGTELEENYNKIKPMIMRGINATTCRLCLSYCKDMIAMVEPYLVKLLEQRTQEDEEFLNNLPDQPEFTTSSEVDYNTDPSTSTHFKPEKKQQEQKEEQKDKKENGKEKEEQKKQKSSSKEKDEGKEGGEEKDSSSKDSKASEENKGASKEGSADEDDSKEDQEGSGDSSKDEHSEEEDANGSSGGSDEEAENEESESDENAQGSGNGEDEDSDEEADKESENGSKGSSGDEEDENDTDDEQDGDDADGEGDEESDTESDDQSDSENKSDSKDDADKKTESDSKSNDEQEPGDGDDYDDNLNAEDQIPDEDLVKSVMEEIVDEIQEDAKDKVSEEPMNNAKKAENKSEEDSKLNEKELSEIKDLYKNDVAKNFSEERGFPLSHPLPGGIKTDANRFRKEMERIFKNKEPYNHRGQKRGVLDSSNLWKMGVKETNVFVKRGVPVLNDYVAYLLWDGSGSMGSDRKEYYSGYAVSVAEEGLKGLVPFKITQFTVSGRGVVHHVVKDFKENSSMNYAHNFSYHRRAGGGNKDGYSIRVATAELMKRPEKDRILFIFSDGLPSDYSGGEQAGMMDVKMAVKEARSKGIFVVSLIFGTEDFRDFNIDKYKFMYEKNIISCSPSEINSQLTKMLKKVLTR